MADVQADPREAELEALARALGGGWRIEQGVMPSVVLTLEAARRLAVNRERAERAEARLAEALNLLADARPIDVPNDPHFGRRWKAKAKRVLAEREPE